MRGGKILTMTAASRLEQDLDKLTAEFGTMLAWVVKRKDPEWDTNAARAAIHKEAANHRYHRHCKVWP